MSQMPCSNTDAEVEFDRQQTRNEQAYESRLSYIKENLKQGGDLWDDMLAREADDIGMLAMRLHQLVYGKDNLAAALRLREWALDIAEAYAETEANKPE